MRLFDWWRNRRELKEFAVNVCRNIGIVNDPMNGCPGDFAEDFQRQDRRWVANMLAKGISIEKIDKARTKGTKMAYREEEEFESMIKKWR